MEKWLGCFRTPWSDTGWSKVWSNVSGTAFFRHSFFLDFWNKNSTDAQWIVYTGTSGTPMDKIPWKNRVPAKILGRWIATGDHQTGNIKHGWKKTLFNWGGYHWTIRLDYDYRGFVPPKVDKLWFIHPALTWISYEDFHGFRNFRHHHLGSSTTSWAWKWRLDLAMDEAALYTATEKGPEDFINMSDLGTIELSTCK